MAILYHGSDNPNLNLSNLVFNKKDTFAFFTTPKIEYAILYALSNRSSTGKQVVDFQSEGYLYEIETTGEMLNIFNINNPEHARLLEIALDLDKDDIRLLQHNDFLEMERINPNISRSEIAQVLKELDFDAYRNWDTYPSHIINVPYVREFPNGELETDYCTDELEFIAEAEAIVLLNTDKIFSMERKNVQDVIYDQNISLEDCCNVYIEQPLGFCSWIKYR